MRFVVIYESETGNTEKVALEIFNAIGYKDKEIINLGENKDIPEADVYFVGFPIHQHNCSLKVIDCLEQIETGKVVLFATCGMLATETYREKLEENLSVWISDDVEYGGLFLCQGETSIEQQKRFFDLYSDISAELSEMLEEGKGHPDQKDLKKISRFIEQVIRKIEEN